MFKSISTKLITQKISLPTQFWPEKKTRTNFFPILIVYDVGLL